MGDKRKQPAGRFTHRRGRPQMTAGHDDYMLRIITDPAYA
jgi:hypothetical protein